MKVTDTCLCEIIDTGMNGEGVAKIENIPVFVPYSAKGDLCKIKITKVNKKYMTAKLVKVIRPSKDRVEAPCSAYGKCGGCCLQHIGFDNENSFKKEYLKNILHKGGIDTPVDDTVFSKPYGYRNKLQMPFIENDGKIALGFYQRGSHNGIVLTECLLNDNWAKVVIKTVCDWANSNDKNHSKTVYNESTGKGLLRHLVCRFVDNFLFVTVVVNGQSLPDAKALYQALSKNFECALYLNTNTKNTNVILGNNIKLLYGTEREIYACGLYLNLSPLSFLQVNDSVRDKLYDFVISKMISSSYIIDVYSGAGIMTAKLAQGVEDARVYGIEIVSDAVYNANGLAFRNGLDGRIKNLCGDASVVLPDLVKKIVNANNNDDKDTISVVLDPPRKGCDESVLNAVVSVNASRVVYVSCNPTTLCRDLQLLTKNYKIVSVTPFNMFPKTSELETVCVLDKIK